MTPTPEWKRTVRAWARGLGADRVVLDCPTTYRGKRLVVAAAIKAIDTEHGQDGTLTARVHDTRDEVIVSRIAGKMVAVLSDPTRREPDGYDERGRAQYRHLPCGRAS